MNLQLMEYMIAISEEKSLSRAADRLLVTQPALSQQLKKLENELGTSLFRREKNEMLLTDAGKVYVHGARSVLNIYQNALEEIRRQNITERKQITMVYNNALLPRFSREVLPEFRRLHPDILLSTIDGNVAIAKDYVMGGMADLAVMASREPTHSMLEFIPIRKDELLLALPEDHAAVQAFSKTGRAQIAALAEEWFILNQSDSLFRTLESRIFAGCSFTPRVLCEIADLEASLNMVANHKGLAFVPRSTHEAEGIRCFSLDPSQEFYVGAAYHKGKTLSRPINDLIRILLRIYDRSLNAPSMEMRPGEIGI